MCPWKISQLNLYSVKLEVCLHIKLEIQGKGIKRIEIADLDDKRAITTYSVMMFNEWKTIAYPGYLCKEVSCMFTESTLSLKAGVYATWETTGLIRTL